MTHRLVFSINSGRVGSEYLARLLATASDTVAHHEPQPTMTGPILAHTLSWPLEETAPLRRAKVEAVRQVLDANPGVTYVETSHMFVKTFHDVVTSAFRSDDLRVVVLRRPLIPTLRSFVRMGYFTSRNQAWPAWMHSAWLPDAVEPPPLPMDEADQVDRCLAYLIDVEQRAQAFVRDHPEVPTVGAWLDELQGPEGVDALFRALDLEPTDATADVIGTRVNHRAGRKAEMGIEVDDVTLHERVRAYLARYETAGRERPALPQLEPQPAAHRVAASPDPACVRPRPTEPPAAPAASSRRRGLRIAHLVNPVVVSPSSDLWVAQPVTFEAMRRARAAAAAAGHDVQLLATGTHDDRAAAPQDFVWTGDLTRTGLDFAPFRVQRPLPVLADLLDGLRTVPDADLYVYTNVDIAPLPHFYDAVAALHAQGHDAMVINRRTISDTYTSPDQLPLMYGEVGQPHPGHDCFVFTPNLLDECDLGDVVVGMNWVGRALIWNLAMHANSFTELTDAHLTFHIGDSRSWQDPRLDDWRAFNHREAESVLARLLAGQQLTASSAIVPYLEDLGLIRR